MASVCVIGTGPAGSVVAHRLSRAGARVVVLESGLDHADPGQQVLSAAVVPDTGGLHHEMEADRHRQLGGNANRWCIKMARRPDGGWRHGIRLARLRAEDVAADGRAVGERWPLGLDDLEPSYRAVEAWWDVECGTPEPARLGIEGDGFEAASFAFAPVDRLRGLSARLVDRPGVELVLGATVDRLVARPDGVVTGVRYRQPDGTRVDLDVDHVVLAAGAVENARLLLLSADEHHPAGLANGNGQVGRHFHDHLLHHVADWVPSDPAIFDRAAFYDLRSWRDGTHHGHLVTGYTEARPLGAAVVLFPRPTPRAWRAIRGARALAADAHRPSSFPSLVGAGRDAVLGLDGLAVAGWHGRRHGQSLLPGFGRGEWSTDPRNAARFDRWEVVVQAEQAIDPRHRIELDPHRRDRFGNPLPRVIWGRDERTAAAVVDVRSALGRRVAERGLGRLEPVVGADGSPLADGASIAHHLGGTRMGDDPRYSVVDRDGRSWQSPNLWIAGSGTFPTGSYVNPTLTIGALAERLGARLVAECAGPSPVVTGGVA